MPYAQLLNISKIRKYLDDKSTEKLIHVLVHSHIDYCNALLYGLPHCLIQKFLENLGVDRVLATLALRGDLTGDLSANRADGTLEVSNAGLSGVVVDDRSQRRHRDVDILRGQTVLFDLTRQEIALGNLQLLQARISGDVDHLHTISKRTRNRVQHVGRGHEEHVGEIER